MQPTNELKALLADMKPALNPGRYAFVLLPPGVVPDPTHIVASVREPEGLSVILPEQAARDAG